MKAISQTAGAAVGETSGDRVLAGLSLAILLAALGTSIANVGLPALARDFGASFQSVQWVVIAYLLAMTATIVAAGRLGDMVGHRRLLLGGIALFVAASLACTVSPGLPLLIAARGVQGIGAAIMTALSMALVGETARPERTGRAMGLLGTMSAVGTALGPSLGGLLISTFGWRSLFLVLAAFGVPALLVVRQAVPDGRPRRTAGRLRFDTAGMVLLTVTLAAYALAMTAGRGGWGPGNIALLGAAAAIALLFVLAERRAQVPIVRLSLLRDRSMARYLAANGLVATVVMATMVVGPFYLSQGLSLDAASVGLVLSAGPVVAALAGWPAGRLVDRLGSRVTSIMGLLMLTAGCAALAAAQPVWGIAGFVAPIAVLTAGYALFQAANNTAVMSVSRPGERGLVSGVLNLSRNLGLITGAAAMGAVFAQAAGGAGVAEAGPAAIADGMHVTFGVGAALALLALGLVSRAR
ncbi:MAG: MFS transporter [Rhizobiaceae bacterium]|nr:MFS transporter [Rhizobiaceae bacterium]